ncbi:MAG: glutathione S-transferase N-terminal domain-containing protein [Burkholderiales bacterium]|nr:glutathione S-transferase N-terminal domain-containing protein [Burkholderiales bacterium]
MKLVIATPSPFARKARIALLEKGVAFEVEVDNPWNPGARAPAHNPLGKIPVLLDDGGEAIFDSRVIVEYAEARWPAPALLPSAPLARVAARRVEAVADGVCDAVVLIVLEHARPAALQSGDWIARQRAKVSAGVSALEAQLGHRRWFVEGAFGLADVAVGCMLGYLDLRLPAFAWRPGAPRLAAWFAQLEERPSFAATRPSAQPIDPVR